MRLHAVTIVAVLVLFAGTAFSQIPPYINYQGILTGEGGEAMPDGAYGMHFRLYDGPEAEIPIWQMAQPIDVVKGIFEVDLGPLELPFDIQYWLSISVEGQPALEPRIPLVSSPYCFTARTVTDGAITALQIADGHVVRTLNSLTDNVNLVPGANVSITPSDNNLIISATGGGGGVSGSGTAGQVAVWDSPSSITGDDWLFWDSANRRLGIGTPGPNARLRVESSNEYMTGVFASTYQSDTTEVIRANYLGGGYVNAVAVKGISLPYDGFGVGGSFTGGYMGLSAFGNGGDLTGYCYGTESKVSGYGSSVTFRFGVWGESYGPNGGYNYGLFGRAHGNSEGNFGVYGHGVGNDRLIYGVYGDVEGNGALGKYAVYGDASNAGYPAFAGFFNGDVFYNGSLLHPSSRMLLTNIKPCEGALDKVLALEPKKFNYTAENINTNIALPRGEHYGLIAQEVEEILPELIDDILHPGSPAESPDDPRDEPFEVKGINYVELIPILVQAIREQQETIAANQRTISAHQKTIDMLKVEVEALKNR